MREEMFDQNVDNVELQEVEVDGANKYILTVAHGDEVRAWHNMSAPTVTAFEDTVTVTFKRGESDE